MSWYNPKTKEIVVSDKERINHNNFKANKRRKKAVIRQNKKNNMKRRMNKK